MTEITIQQASTFVVALTFGVVASVVGEIVRRNAARRNGKQSIPPKPQGVTQSAFQASATPTTQNPTTVASVDDDDDPDSFHNLSTF